MKRFSKKFILCFVIFLVILLGIKIYKDNYTFEVGIYELSYPANEAKINAITTTQFQNKVFLQISDLHNQSFGTNNTDLIDAIDKINPDYIFLTGDMVSAEDTSFDGFYNLIEYIGPRYKCYYVIGNHELGLENDELDNIFVTLEKNNVKYLNNECVYLDNNIALYGLDYEIRFYTNTKFSVRDMERRLGKASGDKFNILITHNPDDFDTYAKWGADIVFCGHNHGGMVKLFGKGVISPNRDLFPTYDGDEIYLDENTGAQMIVSRGMSKGHVGFRLFNTPELVKASLSSK